MHVVVAVMVLAGLVSGCTTKEEAAPDAAVSEQLPPRGDAALRPWLAAGHHLAWACEPEPHPARPPGAHGRNRICSNAALAASASGEFPVGAASVKELHGSSGVTGHAVGIKIAPGTEATSWYWYEVINGSVVADAAGAGLCASCHADAPVDHVFTQVR